MTWTDFFRGSCKSSLPVIAGPSPSSSVANTKDRPPKVPAPEDFIHSKGLTASQLSAFENVMSADDRSLYYELAKHLFF